ncbi:GntR family transcriptional regulator [Ruania alkalisoli]|uniref:GntR family transcriptional regulator n=1 Tax=Ruania alkalisoli TaxID=2779775 RepID=A0A7M1SS75_9MICO|nr:GntR family transcriptional regulator [Ruania alkalisoli]QOR70420.1 GntR family transcriptional regulator [Ruania alkalisoli]
MTPPPEVADPAPRPALALEQPISRGDRVRDVIQAAILDARLPQGTPLVERELSAMLGVSKTPIREALKQLQSSGLVVSTAYQGMRVRVLDAAIVREVTDARLAVEPQALRLAIAARGATTFDEARELLARTEALVSADDTAELSVSNRAFHRCLYAACGNDLLTDFLDKLQALSSFIATAGWHLQATYDEELAEHTRLLAAFERADVDTATTLLRSHISTAAEGTLRALESGSGS